LGKHFDSTNSLPNLSQITLLEPHTGPQSQCSLHYSQQVGIRGSAHPVGQ